MKRAQAEAYATLAALDHGQSLGVFTKPAETGLHSIYFQTLSNSAEFLIQWSKDSACQNCSPVLPSSRLASLALVLLMLRVIALSGANGSRSTCT